MALSDIKFRLKNIAKNRMKCCIYSTIAENITEDQVKLLERVALKSYDVGKEHVYCLVLPELEISEYELVEYIETYDKEENDFWRHFFAFEYEQLNEIDSRLLKEDFDFWKAHVNILSSDKIKHGVDHKMDGIHKFCGDDDIRQVMILVINCTGKRYNFNMTIGNNILMHRDKKLGDKLVQMYEYE